MANAQQWGSLIRFKDESGNILFGEPNDALNEATVFEGNDILNLKKTDRVVSVKEDQILAPFTPDTLICIGLNYKAHAQEAGFPIPPYPVVFHKSKTCITGPYSDIPLPKRAGKIDYENELCVIMAKDTKNVSAEHALDYVLAYTVGNDVSSREWQASERSGGQACFAKSFDSFCPIGPKLVAASVVAEPQDLKMITKRDGKVVQNSSTEDMIFGVRELIAFLSMDTTIPAGALIMTGTPPGVAAFAEKPPRFLTAGETVECEIEKIGAIRNKFV